MHSSTLLEVLSYELTASAFVQCDYIQGIVAGLILQIVCVHVHSEYCRIRCIYISWA